MLSGKRPLLVLAFILPACGDSSAGGETADTGGSSGATTAPTGGADTGAPTTGLTGGADTSGTTGTTGASQGGSTGEPGTDAGSSGGPPPDMLDMGGPPVMFGRCGDEPPPGAILAPEIPTYAGACPILETGYMDGQAPNMIAQDIEGIPLDRSFLVIVPDDMQPDEELPVMFMWHWLGGSSKDFYERADAQVAVNEKRFIAVIPDGRSADQGAPFKWPFSILDPDASMEADFQLFEDMLSCVTL